MLIALILMSLLPAPAEGVPELGSLTVGQRVKVEGRIDPARGMVADEIETAEDRRDVEVEGLIGDLDPEIRTFRIGPLLIRHDDETILGTARQPRTAGDLREGLRVKVKARRRPGTALLARSVRFYEGSADRDFELEAEIDTIDRENGTLVILGLDVRVSSSTHFRDIERATLEGTGTAPGIRRDDDEPELVPLRIWRVAVGGKVGLAWHEVRNRDLNERFSDRGRWLTPRAQLELSWRPGEYSELYSKLSFNPTFNLGDPGTERSGGAVQVRELFLNLRRVFHRSVGLQVGRQRFRDRREWAHDSRLDAVRLHLKRPRLRVELSAARRLLGRTTSRSDQLYLMARGQFRLAENRTLGAYFIKRNDSTGRDEDPLWVGMSSSGQLVGPASYWLEAARMGGRRGKRRLRGYGFDAGVGLRLPLPLHPLVAVGYAYGSGDADRSGGVDRNFRQTGLNDNTERFGGLKRYQYYGTVLDPELFNLRIISVHVGFRPSQDWSLNLAYHSYRQAVAARRFGDAQISVLPSGLDPRLGDAFDVVFAVRKFNRIEVNLAAGVFRPGSAFLGSTVPAFRFRPVFQFFF